MENPPGNVLTLWLNNLNDRHQSNGFGQLLMLNLSKMPKDVLLPTVPVYVQYSFYTSKYLPS